MNEVIYVNGPVEVCDEHSISHIGGCPLCIIKRAMNSVACKCCLVTVEPSKTVPNWTPRECVTCFRYGCTSTINRCDNNGHTRDCAVVPCNCD